MLITINFRQYSSLRYTATHSTLFHAVLHYNPLIYINYILNFSTNSVWNFKVIKRIRQNVFINVDMAYNKVTVSLVIFCCVLDFINKFNGIHQ
jgi:hypothetical protein